MIDFTGRVVVAVILLLLFLVVFVFCLHFYATCCWYRRLENATATTTRRRRRRRFDFAAGHQEITVISALSRGLDSSILTTIPILLFDPKELTDGLECAVCLCEVSQGEKARILPKCNHGFHVDCIDMWFQSHSTCPLCRNPVSNQPSSEPEKTLLQASDPETVEDNSTSGVNLLSREEPYFPTNVLIWGDETQVSTFGPCVEESPHQGNTTIAESSSTAIGPSDTRPNGISVSVVDIPIQINQEEEQKSSMPTRLRSLKRLLSGNHQRINPSSPRDLDLEQGCRGQD